MTTSQRARTVALPSIKLSLSLLGLAAARSLSHHQHGLSRTGMHAHRIAPMPYRCRPACNLCCRACINKEAPIYMQVLANYWQCVAEIEMPARSAVIARRQRSILHRSTLRCLAAESRRVYCRTHVFGTVSHDASYCSPIHCIRPCLVPYV